MRDFGILNLPSISVIKKELSLYNCWISGFTDAEGCFSAYIYIKVKVNHNIVAVDLF
jgi:hypothetical protein